MGAEYLGPPLADGGFGADFTQNELGRRDYVWKNKLPFRLALKAASDEIAWHCTGRGVMNFYESGAAHAQDKMEESIEAHYQASLKAAQDPDGGPYSAYVISGADFATQPYYVAIITPVIHYCRVDENSVVLGADSKPVPGLYAAGEVAGGCARQQPFGRQFSAGLCGLRPRGRRSMYEVRFGRQSEGRFPCWWGIEGSSDQAIVVGGGLAGMTVGAWCCWTSRRSVGAFRRKQQAESTERERGEKDSADSSDTLKGGAKKPELAKLLSSFQCAKRCKSRTLRSAAKRELRGVTLLTSVHSCGCPLGLAAYEVAAA